ncbi:hypothetical protein pb186bvf_004442 [Paramecium bursaria]
MKQLIKHQEQFGFLYIFIIMILTLFIINLFTLSQTSLQKKLIFFTIQKLLSNLNYLLLTNPNRNIFTISFYQNYDNFLYRSLQKKMSSSLLIALYFRDKPITHSMIQQNIYFFNFFQQEGDSILLMTCSLNKIPQNKSDGSVDAMCQDLNAYSFQLSLVQILKVMITSSLYPQNNLCLNFLKINSHYTSYRQRQTKFSEDTSVDQLRNLFNWYIGLDNLIKSNNHRKNRDFYIISIQGNSKTC